MKPRPDGHAICMMLWAVQLSTSSILSSGQLEIHGNVQLVGAKVGGTFCIWTVRGV